MVTIDGTVVLDQNFGGINHIQVPFTHAQTGEIDVTVDSSYPCAPRISNTNWYVWNDSDWNGVSPSDPLIPNGVKVLLLMDSWGTWHNAAFGTRLAHDLPGASVMNTSQPGTTAAWAISNFNALSTGGPYDYIISDFQINDLKADVIGGLTDAALLTQIEDPLGNGVAERRYADLFAFPADCHDQRNSAIEPVGPVADRSVPDPDSTAAIADHHLPESRHADLRSCAA